MDASLPPEITSSLIYTGPGPGSLLDAATGWEGLATGLEDFAAGYTNVVSGLGDVWQGPSATEMATNAVGYTAWIITLAGQARQVGMSALSAAAAFGAVHAAITPPAEVAANRSQLAMLIATNVLGQKLPAIAMNQAQYAEMWARNIAAMLGYQAASTGGSSQLTSAAAVPVAAAANPFAPGTNTATGGIAGLLNFFSGTSASSVGSLLNSNLFTTAIINSIFSSGFPINLLSYGAQLSTASSVSNLPADINSEIGRGLSEGLAGLPGLGPNIPAMSASSVASTGPVTALVGRAVPMGSLSAPPTAMRLLAQETPVAAGDEIAAPFMPMMMPPIGASRKPPESTDPKKKKVEWKGPEITGLVVPRPPAGG